MTHSASLVSVQNNPPGSLALTSGAGGFFPKRYCSISIHYWNITLIYILISAYLEHSGLLH